MKLIRYGVLSIRIYRQIGRKSFGQGATTSDKAFSNFPEQVSITATRDTWFLLLCKDRQTRFAFPGRVFPSFAYNYLHSTCTCPPIFTAFFVLRRVARRVLFLSNRLKSAPIVNRFNAFLNLQLAHRRCNIANEIILDREKMRLRR